MTPLRVREEELSEKLEVVRSQLQSVRSARERSLSLSSLDIRSKSVPEMEPPPPYNDQYQHDHHGL